MANGDKETTTEEIVRVKDPGVVGGTEEEVVAPNRNPTRAIDINESTANILAIENDTRPRSIPSPGKPFLPSTVKILRGPGGSQAFYDGEGLVD